MRKASEYKIPTFTKVLRVHDRRVFSSARGAALNALFSTVGGIYLKDLPRGRLPVEPGKDFNFGIVSNYEKDIIWNCRGLLKGAGPKLHEFRWIYNCPARGLLGSIYPELLDDYFRSMRRRDQFTANPTRRALQGWLQLCPDPDRPRRSKDLAVELNGLQLDADLMAKNPNRPDPHDFTYSGTSSGISRHILHYRDYYARLWGLEVGDVFDREAGGRVKTFAFKMQNGRDFVSDVEERMVLDDMLVEKPLGIVDSLKSKPVICLTTGIITSTIAEMSAKFLRDGISYIDRSKIRFNCEGDVRGIESGRGHEVFVFKYWLEVREFMLRRSLNDTSEIQNIDDIDAMFTADLVTSPEQG